MTIAFFASEALGAIDDALVGTSEAVSGEGRDARLGDARSREERWVWVMYDV